MNNRMLHRPIKIKAPIIEFLWFWVNDAGISDVKKNHMKLWINFPFCWIIC